jgi:hypothetical protein
LIEIAYSVLATFVFTLWPIKKVAGWMGAEKDSYGAVIFALFLSFVLLILAGVASVLLSAFGSFGLVVLAIIFMFAIAFAFSKALVTTYLQGFGIAVFGVILGTVMMIVAMFVLGAGFYLTPYSGEVSVVAFEKASEDVCKCGTDDSCLKLKMIAQARLSIALKDMTFSIEDTSSIQRSNERAQACVAKPANYVAPKNKKTTNYGAAEILGSVQGSNQSAATKTVTEPVKQLVYAWKTTSAEELPKLIGRNVKIVTTEGLDRSGTVEKIEGEVVFVKKSKHFAYSFSRDTIESIQVYEQVE